MEAQRLVEEARAKLGGALIEAKAPRARFLELRVRPEHIVAAARFLKEAGFNHPLSVAGTDYPDSGEIEVVYHVASLNDKFVAALKTRVPRANPSIPSLRSIWLGVHFHEREAWEMLGIKFEEHPELKRFLLQEDWEEGVYPLRKDYRLKPEG
ncbi:MAG: NADH-quinone oxidoreductase subunit C [Candidatus Nezhaarchaeota archaeon]|nr:NADH-quinone oxidoreductase subunit C [Candidatus Nezhaarchaeota archaeon]